MRRPHSRGWSVGRKNMQRWPSCWLWMMCSSTVCGAGPPHGRGYESTCVRSLKNYGLNRQRLIPMTTQPGDGANDRWGRSPSAPVVQRPRVVHMYNREDFCLFAIYGNVPYDESAFLACVRMRPRRRVLDAGPPTINLSLGSNGSGHRACGFLRRILTRTSRDVAQERLRGTAAKSLEAPGVCL